MLLLFINIIIITVGNVIVLQWMRGYGSSYARVPLAMGRVHVSGVKSAIAFVLSLQSAQQNTKDWKQDSATRLSKKLPMTILKTESWFKWFSSETIKWNIWKHGNRLLQIWYLSRELTLSPKACFFFGLAHLGRNADGLHIQLLPWRGIQSRIHNRNPWQDARLRLRGKKRGWVCNILL